ncbi:hypothetical protein LXA25_18760, partial [Erwinia amylovora]|uniref:hypothetical protein n=1 Tax=Erwinia amylovora TaxID=552 RepID=UPI0020C0530C
NSEQQSGNYAKRIKTTEQIKDADNIQQKFVYILIDAHFEYNTNIEEAPQRVCAKLCGKLLPAQLQPDGNLLPISAGKIPVRHQHA